jgi:hypothetical protein
VAGKPGRRGRLSLHRSLDLERQAVVEWLRASGHRELAEALSQPAEMAAPIETLAAGLQVMLRRRFPVQT